MSDGVSAVGRKAFTASFLGWTLDAFDFFLLTFVVGKIATDFKQGIPEVALAITLTLAFRPLGAVIFGWIADRYGRRVPLMVDVALFSVFELATAFSPNFVFFLVCRIMYGIAMGGEWGLGAALAMESLPPKRRGLFSGILQEGYMVGYLLAALVFYVVFTYTHLNWRALFVIGVLPAGLIFYIRAHVPESAVWQAGAAKKIGAQSGAMFKSLLQQWPLFIYAILFMASMNFLSHGTQDLYATFLQKQHGFNPGNTTIVSVIAAFGAIAGGVLFGALSQRYGRRNMILVCAVLGILVIPLWAFSSSVAMLALGGFLMQFMVQGAWGIIPAHLNELSPAGVRGTFPGFTYQIGNLISAGAAQIEATIALKGFALPGGGGADYGKAMGVIALVIFGCVLVFTAIGYFVKPERRDDAFAEVA